jgi:hypothetical protein
MGLGIVGVVLSICLTVFTLCMYVYGIVSAFAIVWWTGLIALFVPPIGFIYGIILFFGGPDLMKKFFDAVQ